ncbi:MlaD family protein [Sulfurospirillum sp. 1612]|uniref:MlaD family protein n=1 Tax=Sulfurospirillum sp. 1612 TaxID=3094835 RepID=UPI002F93A773
MSYNKMRIAVGIFTIFTIVALGATVYFVLKHKGMFEKKYSYAFYATSVENLNVGTPIKYSGFEIGYISQIDLTYAGRAFVQFVVNKEYQKWINYHSYLKLTKPLLGESTISLISEANNPPLSPHAILGYEVQDDIDSLIVALQPVLLDVKDMIKNIDMLTKEIADPHGAFINTLKNVETISGKLAQKDSLIEAMTGERQSSHNIIQTITSLKESMQEIKQITIKLNTLLKEVDHDIITPSKKIPHHINDILQDIKQKLKTLDNLVNTLGKSDQDVVLLKEQILLGVDKTNTLIDTINRIVEEEKHKVTLP